MSPHLKSLVRPFAAAATLFLVLTLKFRFPPCGLPLAVDSCMAVSAPGCDAILASGSDTPNWLYPLCLTLLAIATIAALYLAGFVAWMGIRFSTRKLRK